MPLAWLRFLPILNRSPVQWHYVCVEGVCKLQSVAGCADILKCSSSKWSLFHSIQLLRNWKKNYANVLYWVCCSSFLFFFPDWTNCRLSKLASIFVQEPHTLVGTFRQERTPKWTTTTTKKQLLWELIVWCMRPPRPFPRRVIRKMQLIFSTVPLRRYFTALPGIHLQQPRLQMLPCLHSAEYLSFLQREA